MSTPTTESRIARHLLACALSLPGGGLLAQVERSGFSAHGMTDLQFVYSGSEHGWLERGPDKLRFDENGNDGLQLGRLGAEIGYAFDLQSELKTAVQYYLDPDSSVELTEAYWQHRSFGDTQWRSRYRIGAFYPGFSLENSGPLWTSPYTLSSSAINTWIGEEIRVVGVEGKWTWVGDPHDRSRHRIGVFASLFGYNDPMGAVMSWRGWSVHDRQTGLNGTLPIRELPAVVYSDHSREFEPYMEIDDRPGYYIGAEWSYERTLKLQLVHYDNRADDTIRQDDQYGWRTRFSQVAVHWRGDSGYELLSQFMIGNTIMAGGVVDNDFDSAYVMGVKSWGPHRLALRLEYFRVDDIDGNSFDLNREDGDSQTLSYSYLFKRHWKLTLEGVRFFSDYAARQHFGEETRRGEHQVTASLRYYF